MHVGAYVGEPGFVGGLGALAAQVAHGRRLRPPKVALKTSFSRVSAKAVVHGQPGLLTRPGHPRTPARLHKLLHAFTSNKHRPT